MKELILETNIFIRFFIKDVPSQFEKTREIFEKIEKREIKGFVSILVVNEIIWILENFYNLKREIYLPKLLKLLLLDNIKVIEVKKNLLIKVLQQMQKQKIDFTDIYLSQIAGDKKIFTFDKDFKKL